MTYRLGCYDNNDIRLYFVSFPLSFVALLVRISLSHPTPALSPRRVRISRSGNTGTVVKTAKLLSWSLSGVCLRVRLTLLLIVSVVALKGY